MITAQVLNTIGLGLGMLGVALIFIWGPPQPKLEEGVGRGLEAGTKLVNGLTVGQHDVLIRRRRFRHTLLSRVGLGFVFVGFLFQLLSTWL